ncbi:MAG TPA: methyltransferase domain-containing protein [Jatrophihabitantaceae bacterium]|nr:methyltransferase domain-containing protein [Jatrophihabitantaceae bacterium]
MSSPARDVRDVTVHARQRLVWDVLVGALEARGGPPAQVLDCGGGSGSFAVPLARVGAHVTVVDISVDALATLHRRADEAGVADRIYPVQGDVEALSDAVAVAAFDLVLAHGILEAVDSVEAAFVSIAAALRPGGLLSVLVTNPVASVLARAFAGDLDAAFTELLALDSETVLGPDAVRRLCVTAGLEIERTHGVGVFSEMIPGAALDRPGAGELLAQLEAASATRAPFADIATRVHTLARRPD